MDACIRNNLASSRKAPRPPHRNLSNLGNRTLCSPLSSRKVLPLLQTRGSYSSLRRLRSHNLGSHQRNRRRNPFSHHGSSIRPVPITNLTHL